MANTGVVVRLDGDIIIVEMPIDTLIYACENHPSEPYKISDKVAFGDYIVNNILEFDEDESGTSAFGRLLDELNSEAYCDAQPFIHCEDDEDLD